MRLILASIACAALVAAQKPDTVINSDADIASIAFSKDGSTIAGMCSDNKLRLWDARTGALRSTVAWKQDERAAAMPSGTGLVAVANRSGAIELRDLASGKAVKQFPASQRRGRRLAVASSGSAIAGSSRVEGNSRDEIMRLWDAEGKEKFAVASGIGGTSALALSPDGTLLAAGSYDTDVRVWNARNGELVKRVEEILVSTFALDFTPDGKYLVTAGVDRNVYFWDTKTWKLARKLTGQPEMISALAISADGKFVATGGFSDLTVEQPVKILLRDASSGNVLMTLDSPRQVASLAFSPDGRRLAAAHGRKSIQLWNTARN